MLWRTLAASLLALVPCELSADNAYKTDIGLPAGTFVMGSNQEDADEAPAHVVTFDAAFAMQRNEVTVGDFAKFVKATGYRPGPGCKYYKDDAAVVDPARSWEKPGFRQRSNYPVTCVNIADAKAYARWLSAKTGYDYRLPSEAEWEYAARAGNDGRWPWLNSAQACRQANISDLTRANVHRRGDHNFGNPKLYPKSTDQTIECRDGAVFTAPVRSYRPNAFGLYDMIGNTWEWVSDCVKGGYNAVPEFAATPSDGRAVQSPDCNRHGIRGGAWQVGPLYARLGNRSSVESSARMYHLGFRLVRNLSAREPSGKGHKP